MNKYAYFLDMRPVRDLGFVRELYKSAFDVRIAGLFIITFSDVVKKI